MIDPTKLTNKQIKHLTEQIAPEMARKAHQQATANLTGAAKAAADNEFKKKQIANANARRALLDKFWKEHHHDIMTAVSIGALFFGPIGLLVSAGVSLGDAGMYYHEGDRYNAGLMAGFAILPGLGKVVSKIPAVAQLGSAGMAKLARKLATSSKPVLNRLEMYVIKDMSKYQGLIKTEMDTYLKARAANEAALIARKTSAKGAKKILQKIADGSLKASVVGTKTAGQIGAGFVTFDLYNKAWDNVYVNLGLGKKDIRDKQQQALDKWVKQTESKQMDISNKILETIIKESLQSEQLTFVDKPTTTKTVTVKKPGPFKTQAEGDAFRKWMVSNKPSAARDLNLDETGPYDNDVIKKAYNQYKTEYNQYKQDTNGTSSSDLLDLSGLQWALLIIATAAVGIPITLFGIKLTRGVYYLSKYRKQIVPMLRSGKLSEFRKLLKSKEFRKLSEAEREKLIDLLKNPGAKAKLIGAMDEMMINSFFKNQGVTADELRDVLDPEVWKKYGPTIEKKQAQRDAMLAKKSQGTQSTSKVSTLKPIKLAKTTRDAKWTSAQAFNLNLDAYAAEVANTKNGIYGVNDLVAYKKGYTNNITKDWEYIKTQFAQAPGSKDGVWVLNSHIDASKFPDFSKWRQDLLAANPKMNANALNADRYRRAKAKWYIIKNFS